MQHLQTNTKAPQRLGEVPEGIKNGKGVRLWVQLRLSIFFSILEVITIEIDPKVCTKAPQGLGFPKGLKRTRRTAEI